MPWREEELVAISALQHYAYCPRQCALIHVEQTFDENLFTLRGRRAHEKVDEAKGRRREGVRVEHALPLWSERLGLVGRADAVEFHPSGPAYPVEHKVGPRKERRADDIQLCAQALCLEEMLQAPIPRGAIFHHASGRRREVLFTAQLRAETEDCVAQVRALLSEGRLPPPVADARCPPCSLLDACMPFALMTADRRLKEAWR